jgi:hypothetical protein
LLLQHERNLPLRFPCAYPEPDFGRSAPHWSIQHAVFNICVAYHPWILCSYCRTYDRSFCGQIAKSKSTAFDRFRRLYYWHSTDRTHSILYDSMSMKSLFFPCTLLMNSSVGSLFGSYPTSYCRIGCMGHRPRPTGRQCRWGASW